MQIVIDRTEYSCPVAELTTAKAAFLSNQPKT